MSSSFCIIKSLFENTVWYFSCPAQRLLDSKKMEYGGSCVDGIVWFFYREARLNARSLDNPGDNHFLRTYAAMSFLDASVVGDEHDVHVLKKVFFSEAVKEDAYLLVAFLYGFDIFG